MAQLPLKGYLVFLDNLFINVKLLCYIKACKWGAISIYIAKSGLLKRFCGMKKEDASKDKIPWGTLFIKPFKDNLINFIA